MYKRIGLIIGMLTFFLMLFPVEKVYAAEEVLGPLIQTTNPREEYLGLVHLELLQTEKNINGSVEQSIQNVIPSVVRIQTGNFIGSGIILEIEEDTLLIASNRHQLIHQEFSGIELYNDEVVSGKRIYLSEKYDLGFLIADISNLSYESRSELRCIRMEEERKDALVSGAQMFHVGSTDGVARNIYQGMIADTSYYFDEFDSFMIYNYCEAKAGMSGGGTYDSHGYCIGMLTGGYQDESASLPMKYIREEWEMLKGQ